MKKQRTLFVILCCALLGVVSLTPVQVSAVPVEWSDDFNDGNFDGWTVLNGTWDASENYLRATSSDVSNTIYYDSNATFGTFSFDFFKDESISSMNYRIFFSSDKNFTAFGEATIPANGHLITIFDDEISFLKVINQHYTFYHDDYLPGFSFDGWYSITVKIISNYSAKLWFEGELVIDTVSIFAFTDIECFYVVAPENGAIDNIVVNEEELVATTTTTTTETTTGPTTTSPTSTTPTSPTMSSTSPTTVTSSTTTTPTTTTTTAPPPFDPGTVIIIVMGVGGAVVVIVIIVIVSKKRGG